MEDLTQAAPSCEYKWMFVCVVQGQLDHCRDVEWERWLWWGCPCPEREESIIIGSNAVHLITFFFFVLLPFWIFFLIQQSSGACSDDWLSVLWCSSSNQLQEHMWQMKERTWINEEKQELTKCFDWYADDVKCTLLAFAVPSSQNNRRERWDSLRLLELMTLLFTQPFTTSRNETQASALTVSSTVLCIRHRKTILWSSPDGGTMKEIKHSPAFFVTPSLMVWFWFGFSVHTHNPVNKHECVKIPSSW